jgi:hypothetical protein
MTFAIKAEIRDPRVKALAFTAQKTMYGGKHIAQGDTVFVFASENEGGCGLIARHRHLVRSGCEEARQRPTNTPGQPHDQTHRMATRRLGRSELKSFTDWEDGRPETELNFKFYRTPS